MVNSKLVYLKVTRKRKKNHTSSSTFPQAVLKILTRAIVYCIIKQNKVSNVTHSIVGGAEQKSIKNLLIPTTSFLILIHIIQELQV